MSSKRVYRQDVSGSRLTFFSLKVKETDLWIAVDSSAYHETLPARVEQFVLNKRNLLEEYLAANPHLATSLEPCLLPEKAPEIFRSMLRSSNLAGVGPMASVAGAFAEAVGIYLLNISKEVVIENGGDIFLKVLEPVNVGIYAGTSPLSGKLALRVDPDRTPLGVCTSSGTVGPSLSLGKADAAVVLSPSTLLADAMATKLGNLVKTENELKSALEFAGSVEGVSGALLIYGHKVAVWGEIELKKYK